MKFSHSFVFALALVASFGAACGQPPAPAATQIVSSKRVDQATAGAIAGRVTFTGQPPSAALVRMGIDTACVSAAGPNPQSAAVLVGADAGIKNVFVYVKAGFDEYAFDTPTEAVTMDQKGCVYAPRVFGVRVGQPIEILNSDDTIHNVHALPMQNQEFNEGQPRRGMRTSKVFTVPEVMVRFKCDFHGWMAAHVGVMSHPFFAVTDATGAFEITGLPPGTYTVEAWHETFGTRAQELTVPASGRQTLALTFGLS